MHSKRPCINGHSFWLLFLYYIKKKILPNRPFVTGLFLIPENAPPILYYSTPFRFLSFLRHFLPFFLFWIFNIYFLVQYGMCSIRSCLVWTWFFNSISSRFFCIWLFVMDKNSMCGALSSYTLCSVCSKKSRTPWLIQYSATFHNFSWKILTRVGFLYEAHLKTDHDSFSF